MEILHWPKGDVKSSIQMIMTLILRDNSCLLREAFKNYLQKTYGFFHMFGELQKTYVKLDMFFADNF